jgi:hypothetical protein
MGIIYATTEQIKTARQADLLAWLRAHGYDLEKAGRHENWRIPGMAGLIVQGNHYYHFGSGLSGNSIDFLVDYLSYKFQDAVDALLTTAPAQPPISAPEKQAPGQELQLPIRGTNHHRVIAYLNKARGLPADLIIELIRSKLLYQDDRGNCVFPCLVKSGELKGAIIRGTCTDIRYVARAKGTDESCGWHWPPRKESGLLFLTESPIDAISLAVIRPLFKVGHILAIGGLFLAGVNRFLAEHHMVRTVVFALDNDQPGLDAAWMWSVELHERGYNVQICLPERLAKDWNDLLILNSDFFSVQSGRSGSH